MKLDSQETYIFSIDKRNLYRVFLSFFIVLLTACGGGGEKAEVVITPEVPIDIIVPTLPTVLGTPEQLVVFTTSATTVELAWNPTSGDNTEPVAGYKILRNGIEVNVTTNTHFSDTNLTGGIKYTYTVIAYSDSGTVSSTSNEDSARTLDDDIDTGMFNGGVGTTTIFNIANANTDCSANRAMDMAGTDLEKCLAAALDTFSMKTRLYELRAFTARLRRQQDAELVKLGMRLFHSKSLSTNRDVACSSCHHPALGCGGDDLSIAIGVNAISPDVLGVGRSDGNNLPTMGRHSQQTCNSGLWSFALFWDNRVKFDLDRNDITGGDDNIPSEYVALSAQQRFDNNKVRSEERDVSDKANSVSANINDNSLALLMVQSHFPIVAPEEMGEVDLDDFVDTPEYREFLAQRLSTDWDTLFTDFFGDNEKSYLRVSQALAAYQASQLFIENPFFDFLDGESNALTEQEKHGALLFFSTQGTCVNCHEGAFFTPEKTRPPAYPQIGLGGNGDFTDNTTFRVPSLLNVELTAPWGHVGQFQELERVVMHYSHTPTSIDDYFSKAEYCELNQFKHLGTECQATLNPSNISKDATWEVYINQIMYDRIVDAKIGEDVADNIENEQDVIEILGITQQVVVDSYYGDQIVFNYGLEQVKDNAFDTEQVNAIVSFLHTLTDESARAGSNEINSLIPLRDGGPDGFQLDAVDNNNDVL